MLSSTTFFYFFFIFYMKDLNPGSFSFSQYSIFKPISVPLLRSLLLPQCSPIPFSTFSAPTQVIWPIHFPKSFQTCFTLYLKLISKLKFEIFMQLFMYLTLISQLYYKLLEDNDYVLHFANVKTQRTK